MKTYVDLDEIVQMENVAKCLRDTLLIRLLFYLGCRVSEALALIVEDHQIITTTMKYRKVAGKEHRQWYNRLWHNRPY